MSGSASTPPGAPGHQAQDQPAAASGNSLASRIELLARAQKARRQQPQQPQQAHQSAQARGGAAPPSPPRPPSPRPPAAPAARPDATRPVDIAPAEVRPAHAATAKPQDPIPDARSAPPEHLGQPQASGETAAAPCGAALDAEAPAWADPRVPAGSRYTFEQWEAAYEGSPMLGEHARVCVFEIHAAQNSTLVCFPLRARDGSPTIDAAAAFYLNRCLLLGPAAPRRYPQAEDRHPFPLVSPSLGLWNYRVVRPTDPEYEAECGFLRGSKWLGEGYVLGQPDKPAPPAPAAAEAEIHEDEQAPAIERPRGG